MMSTLAPPTASASEQATLIVECAWCNVEIRRERHPASALAGFIHHGTPAIQAGAAPKPLISHGICDACVVAMERMIDFSA